MATNSNKLNFLYTMLPYAQQVQTDTGANAVNVLSQWAHETGYGTNTGAKNNNYAGLYAYSGSPYGGSGKKYNSINDFLTDYEATISNSRYRGALTASNPTQFAKALKAGGYASDPNYASASTWTEVPKLLLGLDGSTNSNNILFNAANSMHLSGNITGNNSSSGSSKGSKTTYPFARYNPLVGGVYENPMSSLSDKITDTAKGVVSNLAVVLVRVTLVVIAIALIFMAFRNGLLGGNS